MGNAGIGTPYWYEWEIGIIECLHMMTDASIESVTLQSSKFQSLDDVVINYADGSIANIQVKHTDVNDSLTYSDLESDKMLKSWASEWSKVKANYKIKSLSIVTNRKWGPRTANGKCSFSHFITEILPKLKSDPTYYGNNTQERNAIEWFRKTINLNEDEIDEFIQIIQFKNQEDLAGLEVQIKYLLSNILGTDKEEVINTAIEKLRSSLEKWVTSRREKPEITKEDIYNSLCEPHYRLPEYKLSPTTPILPSRLDFADQFTKRITESDKSVIFLQGLPGAGKTNFISYLAQATNSIVDFRYYTYLPVNADTPSFSDDEGFYSGKDLWSSILSQIKSKFEELNLLSELEFPLLYDYLTITKLRVAVFKFLPVYAEKCGRTCYLFIDGMDHAARSSKTKDTFLSQLPRPDEVGNGVKFILVGQPINDKYPKWLIKNPDIEYIELPTLEANDIKTIIEAYNITIKNVDIDTLSSSLIQVVGNNTLNVLFAILEIKRLSADSDFDGIINHLLTRRLNNYIDRYYEWIVNSISSESEILLLKLEAIYAFASRKISIENLVDLCESDKLTVEAVLHKLYPVIVSDDFGYYVFHNDVRLYFKEVIRANSNFANIIDSVTSSIIKNETSDEFKYDILFNLNLETHNLDKVFVFYNPDYIIGSINYQIPIDRLVEQFSNVIDLFKGDYDFEMTHRLSLVSTTISKLIECVNYYEQEKRFIEAKMSSKLTHSEKYVLKSSDAIPQIIDDIYKLLKMNECERANKLYVEYFSDPGIEESLADDDANQEEFEKIGYICRFYNPDVLRNLTLDNCYVAFVSGWLDASTHFYAIPDIQQTFTFCKYNISSLHNYVSEITKNPNISNETIAFLSTKFCSFKHISIHTLTELCFSMLLKKIPSEEIQSILHESVIKMDFFGSLGGDISEYKIHGIQGFFKTYFCLYKYDNTIDWDMLYKETLKNKRITAANRGYEPAIQLKELAENINSLFYDSEGTYSDIIRIACDLTYFTRNRVGSCDDCGTFEVLPYFKRVFLQYFVNASEYAENTKLCIDLLNIFTGKDPHYIDELAQLYYLFDKKELFLQIAEFWCGSNGIVWQNEYDDLEYICTHIASLLNKFNETEFANKIQKIMNLRILGYVGRKDYTLNGLLECYKFLPNNSEKILSYGMNLLTLCDYANEIGDNQVNADDALFDVACELGFKYLDALFELKNTPDNLTYWRQEVLSVLYDKIDKLFTNDDQRILLYKLTNAWLKAEIENNEHLPYNNELETLYDYNHRLIDSISDADIKTELIANGNCTPNMKDADYLHSHEKKDEQYSYILDRLDTEGYTVENEKEIAGILMYHNGSLYSLIIEIVEHLPDQSKKEFISKYVIPYLVSDSDYGFRSHGQMYIIEQIYTYFDIYDWKALFDNAFQRVSKVRNDLDYFYYLNDDIEFLALHFYLQNLSDKIVQLFMDRSKMHFSFISSSNAILIEHQHINVDEKINTFDDFIKKQLGDIC